MDEPRNPPTNAADPRTDAQAIENEAADRNRRDFFKAAAVAAGVGAVAGALHGKYASAPLISEAQAQTGTAPWWPSRWGAGDEAGASNWITPEKVLDAVKWIREGKIYRIGRIYEAGMPLFGARVFALRIPGGPTGGPFGENKLVYNDEFLATEVGQVGTQFDGLGHIGIALGKDGDKSEMRYYNGFTAAEINTAYGLAKLGMEKAKPFFTRAHLVDVAPLKSWDVGQEIRLADVRAALDKQGLKEADIKAGDAVFFNTGWGALWMKNNDRFNSGEPGIGLEVARWVVEKQLALVGSDTWGTEAVPNPDKKLAFPVHGELITKNGIFNHENLVFDELIRDRKYQFVYIFSPMPIKGATGSAGGPIAVA
jgi:kynurenine formamidase